MRPVSVFANGPAREIAQLEADLHGRWRQATRAVMVLLSAHGLAPAQIAVLLDCHPATVRRWIGRFNDEGLAGLADRPRPGRPALGGRQLTGRIAALLTRPGPWTLPRIRRYLGWPQVSPRTLYRRVRLVAVWRRPKLTARGDPDHDHVVAGIVARLIDLPRQAVVLAEDETHLNLLPHVRASWTLRGARPHVLTPGTNQKVTVLGAIEMTTGERIWAALKNYVANTAVTWPGRLRQIHAFFRTRSPDQMLATAAPWTSPWLPPGYEQNFWNGALVQVRRTCRKRA